MAQRQRRQPSLLLSLWLGTVGCVGFLVGSCALLDMGFWHGRKRGGIGRFVTAENEPVFFWCFTSIVFLIGGATLGFAIRELRNHFHSPSKKRVCPPANS